MKQTLLATAVWAACSTMAFSANAAVSSGSIFNKDTTISEDVVLTSNGYLNFTDGSKGECQDFCVWGGYSRGSPTRLPFVVRPAWAISTG